MDTEWSELFRSLSARELEFALSKVPADPIDRFVLFTEVTRVLDYWSVLQFLLPENRRLSEQDFQLLQWGWNVAAAQLTSPLADISGFPVIESTERSREFAASLLHSFGRSSLALRSAEMIRQGFLEAMDECGSIVVRRSEIATFQGVDQLEFDRLDRFLETWRRSPEAGWKVRDINDFESVRSLVGRFTLLEDPEIFSEYIRADIDELMRPLIRPWDSGRGVMMAYGARPEVDDHFLAHAARVVLNWRAEAGLHPSIEMGGVSGSEVTAVILVVTSLHAKHVNFARLAAEMYGEISIPQSLTIWGRRADLVESIVELTEMDSEVVSKALSVISMVAGDSSHLQGYTTPFSPLLYDLENGYILRSVSSIYRNPFPAIMAFQKWREPAMASQAIVPREGWMRTDVYALFQGSRYIRVAGSVKVRLNGRIATDVDAAIYDRITGVLALFQFKWQDFYTNDVRELCSRASNFVKEMDVWADKVESWVDCVGLDGLAQSLKLKKSRRESISRVYLFGLSRTIARMQGFGRTTTCERLAVCNWPQFVRVRHEASAEQDVFLRMHEVIRSEMQLAPSTRPIPVTFQVFDKDVRYEDLWEAVENEGKAGAIRLGV